MEEEVRSTTARAFAWFVLLLVCEVVVADLARLFSLPIPLPDTGKSWSIVLRDCLLAWGSLYLLAHNRKSLFSLGATLATVSLLSAACNSASSMATNRSWFLDIPISALRWMILLSACLYFTYRQRDLLRSSSVEPESAVSGADDLP